MSSRTGNPDVMKILIGAGQPALISLIRRSLERFPYHCVEVDNGLEAFQRITQGPFDLALLECGLPQMKAPDIVRCLHSIDGLRVPPVIVLTRSDQERRQIADMPLSQIDVIGHPFSIRELVSKIQKVLNQRIPIACLGGGTGLFTLLSGLKSIPGTSLTSIVSMSDDGGSTGELRDMFGILPPGDIRRSLVALSTAPDLLNELIQYRFNGGRGLNGHTIGNLLLTALCQTHGSMYRAVKALSEILNIQGEVIPVTESVNTLKAEREDGSIIEGEHRFDLFQGAVPAPRVRKLWQEPAVAASPDAITALYKARFIILGPGDLYTSVISNLIVDGIAEAVVSSPARKIYICNVMTKPGETSGFQVSDHLREIVHYLREDCLAYVLCSTTKCRQPSLRQYAEQGQVPVAEDAPSVLREITGADIVWADIASESELLRHDSLKLADEVKRIIERENGG